MANHVTPFQMCKERESLCKDKYPLKRENILSSTYYNNKLYFNSNNGKAITNFDQTPLMSTYLIAFIISDFNYREFNATNDYNTTQRIFTNIDHINQTSYALVEGITILKALENYLQIPFVLKKLDHAAMPDYQALGNNMASLNCFTRFQKANGCK